MNKKLNVLLVEDHAADRRLVEEAIADCHIDVDLQAVSDGEHAINYIKKNGEYAKASRPDLIILDLNMPRKGGHEFLEEVHTVLKADDIPVVLLTVSDDQNDIQRALDSHMNYYMAKPVNGVKLQQVLSVINELWTADHSHCN